MFLLTEDLANDTNKSLEKIYNFLQLDGSIQIDTEQQYNVASEAKSKRLMNFLNQPHIIKEGLKRVLPNSIHKPLKLYITSKNLRAYNSVPKMNSETEARLRNLYQQDVEVLAEIIGRDLSHWLHTQSGDNNRKPKEDYA